MSLDISDRRVGISLVLFVVYSVFVLESVYPVSIVGATSSLAAKLMAELS